MKNKCYRKSLYFKSNPKIASYIGSPIKNNETTRISENTPCIYQKNFRQ